MCRADSARGLDGTLGICISMPAAAGPVMAAAGRAASPPLGGTGTASAPLLLALLSRTLVGREVDLADQSAHYSAPLK